LGLGMVARADHLVACALEVFVDSRFNHVHAGQLTGGAQLEGSVVAKPQWRVVDSRTSSVACGTSIVDGSGLPSASRTAMSTATAAIDSGCRSRVVTEGLERRF